MWVKLAKCCTPVPADSIVGFVTRGDGVSVHRVDCTNADLADGQARPAASTSSGRRPRRACSSSSIQVEALDRNRLLSDVTRVLSDQHVNILSASVHDVRDRIALSRFTFEMGDPKHLDHVLGAVRGVEGVFDVYRVTSARRDCRADSASSGASSLSAARAPPARTRSADRLLGWRPPPWRRRGRRLGPVRLQPADRLVQLLDGGLARGPWPRGSCAASGSSSARRIASSTLRSRPSTRSRSERGTWPIASQRSWIDAARPWPLDGSVSEQRLGLGEQRLLDGEVRPVTRRRAGPKRRVPRGEEGVLGARNRRQSASSSDSPARPAAFHCAMSSR